MAKKLSKRVAANRAKVELGKLYDVKEAIDLVKGCASAKFDESFDVAVQLGIDPKKSDQTVRGACCRKALARLFVLLCSPRVPALKKRRLPVLTSSVSTTSPTR